MGYVAELVRELRLSADLATNYQEVARDAVMFSLFALIALPLASLGLYAAVSQAIQRRTQEIGVRVALSATNRNILVLVFEGSAKQIGLGVIAGLAGSIAVTRLLESELVGVSANDPLTLGIASLVLIAVAALGCLLPARRALSVCPTIAFKAIELYQ
jgi:putative ABC transport system permease protein